MNISKNIFTVIITFIICLCATITAVAQDFYIPYRQGSLFGLVNQENKIKLKAKYNVLDVLDASGTWFAGYYHNGNKQRADIINNNKVIIKNSDFNQFILRKDYILAYKDGDDNNHQNIYSFKGKKILPGDKKAINAIPNHNRNTKKTQYLFWVHESDGTISTYIYNPEIEKITQTLFERKLVIEGNWYELDYDINVEFILKESENKGTKIIISRNTDNFSITSSSDIEITPRQEATDYPFGGYGVPEPAHSDYHTNTNKNDAFVPKKITIASPKPHQKTKSDSIEYQTFRQENHLTKIFKEGNFQGIKNKSNELILIPAVYDEIIFLDSSQFTCILKKDNKYGFAYYLEKDKQAVVEPVFDLLPFPIIKSYGNDKMILIRLFDKEGKFYCYANEKGELFLKQ